MIAAIVLVFIVDEIRWIRRENEYRQFPLRRWLVQQMRRAVDFVSSW